MTSVIQRVFMGSRLEPKEPIYTMNEVAEHCDVNSCWIVLWDKVYDVTDLLCMHPGGLDVIMENAGTDATVPFVDKGHSKFAISMIDKYYIGELAECDRRKKCGS